MSHEHQERIQAALARLGAVTREMVAMAERRSRQSCAYKTAARECTFVGGCVNQQREENKVRCGGDEFLCEVSDERS